MRQKKVEKNIERKELGNEKKTERKVTIVNNFKGEKNKANNIRERTNTIRKHFNDAYAMCRYRAKCACCGLILLVCIRIASVSMSVSSFMSLTLSVSMSVSISVSLSVPLFVSMPVSMSVSLSVSNLPTMSLNMNQQKFHTSN